MEETVRTRVKSKIPQIRNMHLAIRLLAMAFLLVKIFAGKAMFFSTEVSPMIPAGIAACYTAIAVIVTLAFSDFTFVEPALIFLDYLAGLVFVFLYKADVSFAIPFFLAAYTAGMLSWGASFFVGLGGTILFSLEAGYLQGFNEKMAANPTWLFVFVLNVAISTLGLLKSDSVQQAVKMDSLVSLIEAGQELGSTLTYEQLFKLTFDMTRSLFHANTCVIYLKEQDGRMKLSGVESPYPRLFQDFDPKVVKSALSQIAAERTPELFTDVQILPSEEEQLLPKTAKTIRAGMAAPLVSEGELIGLIFVATEKPQRFNVESLKLFTVLANQTAISIRNVQLHEKTTVMAITDSVSGLYTHGYMQEALEREFRRCKYGNFSLSTVILDVDHFKVVNDTYGHPQGDALLRQLGSVIKSMTRSNDVVCRYGGDEFMIILPETNRIGAVLVAERVRQAVEEYEFVLGSKIVHITISGGVASFPEDIETKKELIEKTDQALYLSKQGGRNKVSFTSS